MKKSFSYTNQHYIIKLLKLKKIFCLKVFALVFCTSLCYAQNAEQDLLFKHLTLHKSGTITSLKNVNLNNKDVGNFKSYAFNSLQLKVARSTHKIFNNGNHQFQGVYYWIYKNKSDLPIASFHSSDHTLKAMASYLIDIRKLTQKGFTILKMDAFSKKVSV